MLEGAVDGPNLEDVGTNKPRFVLVELSQLEKLLQHCPECGRAPGGRSTGKPRNIAWTKKGKNKDV